MPPFKTCPQCSSNYTKYPGHPNDPRCPDCIRNNNAIDQLIRECGGIPPKGD